MAVKRCPGMGKGIITDHQEHYVSYPCEDVIEMEKVHGLHGQTKDGGPCPFTGYISAKACGCRAEGKPSGKAAKK